MYYKYLNYRKDFKSTNGKEYNHLRIGAILYDPDLSYISLIYSTDFNRINYYYDEINTFLIKAFLTAFHKEVMCLNDRSHYIGKEENKDSFIRYLNDFLKNDFYFDEEWIVETKIDSHLIGKFTNIYDLMP